MLSWLTAELEEQLTVCHQNAIVPSVASLQALDQLAQIALVKLLGLE